MKNYSEYNTEDFLQDERFRSWMISGGNEHALFWENFEKQHPERSNELRLAKNLFSSLHQLRAVPGDDVKIRIWNRVENSVEEADTETRQIGDTRSLYRRWWTIAASLLLAGGLAWMFRSTFIGTPLEYSAQVSQSETSLQETVNNTKNEQTVLLKDGSSVKLKPGSKLSHSDFAENQRVVFLDGEAYFDVTKDASKPFIVYAGNIVVQVVGTSFNVVSSTGSSRSNVSVNSGKVKVFAAKKIQNLNNIKDDEVVYLIPNQRVDFDVATNVFVKGLIEEPVLVGKSGSVNQFYFTNTSVSDILHELETAYGVQMRFDNSSLASCKVTAPLGDLPLFRKLDIICQTIGATYEVFGTEIVISGGSCEL